MFPIKFTPQSQTLKLQISHLHNITEYMSQDNQSCCPPTTIIGLVEDKVTTNNKMNTPMLKIFSTQHLPKVSHHATWGKEQLKVILLLETLQCRWSFPNLFKANADLHYNCFRFVGQFDISKTRLGLNIFYLITWFKLMFSLYRKQEMFVKH